MWGRDADRYRDAVRTTLYAGLSAVQLEALVATLLIVRKQSVTDNLSPAVLHELLTEGLPPLDDTEIAKVARGFEDLDRRRDTIAEMESDVEAVRALDAAVRRYARSVVAREAAAVRSAETRRDDVTRREREARTAHEQALDRQRTLRRQDTEREAGIDQAQGRLDGLRASAAYHRSGDLRDARRLAEQAAVSRLNASTSNAWPRDPPLDAPLVDLPARPRLRRQSRALNRVEFDGVWASAGHGLPSWGEAIP